MITLFYNLISEHDENAKIIGLQFEKYYKKDLTVSYMDIFNRATGQYNDDKLIVLSGYDIIGKLQARYKISGINLKITKLIIVSNKIKFRCVYL